MKIDSLWLKIFGGVFVLNIVYWALSATILDFSNVVTGSLFFSIYVAPAILPLAPWMEQWSNHSGFVVLIGALCVLFLPLFWSLVLYGVVRLVRKLLTAVK